MRSEIIEQSARLWSNEPEKAKVSPTVKARSNGAQAMIEAGPFSWQCDLPPVLGGENKSPSPRAILLGALAGCAVVFVRDVLAPQMGVRIDDVEAEVGCQADFLVSWRCRAPCRTCRSCTSPSTSARPTARKRCSASTRRGWSAAPSIWRSPRRWR